MLGDGGVRVEGGSLAALLEKDYESPSLVNRQHDMVKIYHLYRSLVEINLRRHVSKGINKQMQ